MRYPASRVAIVRSVPFLIVWIVSGLGLTGFGPLLEMALSYAAGTFQPLAAISPPAEMAPSRR